jgi:hypothetical protein
MLLAEALCFSAVVPSRHLSLSLSQIWNPYGNDKMGHKSFICVEAVRNTNPVELVPGEGWHAAMSLRAAAK